MNSQDLNDASIFNNLSLGQARNRKTQVQGPDADQTQAVIKEGDITSFKFTSSQFNIDNKGGLISQRKYTKNNELAGSSEIQLIENSRSLAKLN